MQRIHTSICSRLPLAKSTASLVSERERVRQQKTLLRLIPYLQLFPFPCHDTSHMTFCSFFSTIFHRQPLLTTCRTYRDTHRIGIHSLPHPPHPHSQYCSQAN